MFASSQPISLKSTGQQRDWIWQGWHTRYTFIRSQQPPTLPPILFLHGFGASIGHWRQNLPFFAQNHTVYALDLLGFGASEKAPIAYSVDLWVQQVRDFWQTFIGQPMILVGNSIGSLIALSAAHTYPEMVQGLTMISLPDPSLREDLVPAWCRPISARMEQAFAADWLLKPLFYWVRRPQVVRPWIGLAYARPEAVTDELVDILTTPAGDRGAAQAFSNLLQAMVNPRFGPKVSVVLPTLNIPILLIWGDQDRMVPPTFAKTFAAMNARIQLVELDNAGHCPHDECFQEVNQLIETWLQNNL
jgi:pimeloyl-ACP methyl ester carboxylesterase